MAAQKGLRWSPAQVAVRFIVLLTLTYVVLVGFLMLSEDRMIFIPPSGIARSTPEALGLSFQSLRIPVDGGQVDAWFLEQPAQDSPIPVVFYCHGNGNELSQLVGVSAIFYSLGWNVMLFDYRGYGQSSPPQGPLSEDSVVADARAAFDWLSQRFPKDRIVIWGHSLGSSIAARVARDVRPAGVILEGAFPSVLDMAHYRFPGIPIFDFMIANKFNTAAYLAESSFPKLLLHAENDRVVPLELGRNLLERIAGPKELLVLDGIGHNDLPSVHNKYDEQFKAIVRQWVVAPVH
jgi:pimeloyl-ACP methyl ester carboxylesterase